MKIPKGIVEDVLVKVDKFYYPVDFVVFDTEPVAGGTNQVPIILGRPFLSTSNSIINCRNGVMQLTFGNMTLELNIFHLSNKQKPVEDEGRKSDEVFLSGTRVGRHDANKQKEELMENNEAVNEESTIPPATISPLPPDTKLPKTKELSMKAPAAHTTAYVEELLLLNPP